MNINFWKDEWWNEILINREWYLLNIFTMIDNWYFEWKMNKKVINIIRKSDEELMSMWFDSDDITEIRLQTSEEVLIKNWFDIRELCIFDISKNKKEFVVKVMNLIEKCEKCEKVDYILSISNSEKIKIWLIMSDLDLLSWSEERSLKTQWFNF